jgi:hypothetical protein
VPELILLCAGAATDPADPGGDPAAAALPDPFAREGQALARELSGGVLAQAFLRARIAAESADASPLPRELPDEGWLRARFGVAPGDSVAAWAAAAHGLSAPRWRATPVHVEVGRHQIVLADPAALDLTAGDAAALAEAARPCLAAAGFALELALPDRWFLSGNAGWQLDTHAWTMAVGRSIDGHLPRGEHARDWRRIFTEIQMAWHEHPVNEQRAGRGLPPVNALWLDGCAREPLTAAPLVALTDDDAIAGLAAASGVSHRPLSAGGAGVGLAGAPAGRDVLVDPGFWRQSRRLGDAYGWREAWLRFERWLPELLRGQSVPDGFERIRLVASAERRCVELVLARGDRWRLLRRFDAAAALLR